MNTPETKKEQFKALAKEIYLEGIEGRKAWNVFLDWQEEGHIDLFTLFADEVVLSDGEPAKDLLEHWQNTEAKQVFDEIKSLDMEHIIEKVSLEYAKD